MASKPTPSLDYALIKLTSSVPGIISILHAAAQSRERLYTLIGLCDTHSKPVSQERTYYAIGNELNIDYYKEVSRINIASMTSRYIYIIHRHAFDGTLKIADIVRILYQYV